MRLDHHHAFCKFIYLFLILAGLCAVVAYMKG